MADCSTSLQTQEAWDAPQVHTPEEPKPPKKRRSEGWLKEPFTKEEQRYITRMAREHGGLIKYIGSKMVRKFWWIDTEDVFCCIDFAFLKSCRAWDPERGKFSTIFSMFAQGELLHWTRDRGFAVKAPHKVRALGSQIKQLLEKGYTKQAVIAELQITDTELKDALIAVSGMAHDIKGFELHVDPRLTPMEWLIEQEEQQEMEEHLAALKELSLGHAKPKA